MRQNDRLDHDRIDRLMEKAIEGCSARVYLEINETHARHTLFTLVKPWQKRTKIKQELETRNM